MREAEGSYGYTLDELSRLFEDLGCTAAYNLDGGQSSVIAHRSFFNRNGFPIG